MSAQVAALTWSKSKGAASKFSRLQPMCTKCSTNPHTSLITSWEDLHLELGGTATNRQGMSPEASQRVINAFVTPLLCNAAAQDMHWMVWPSVQDTGMCLWAVTISSTPTSCRRQRPEKFQLKTPKDRLLYYNQERGNLLWRDVCITDIYISKMYKQAFSLTSVAHKELLGRDYFARIVLVKQSRTGENSLTLSSLPVATVSSWMINDVMDLSC